MRLHHVQISMPPGQEVAARRFYAEALGLTEVTKPGELAGRGGCWFRTLDGEVVTAELHLGVEEGFVAPRRAHPALVVGSVDELEGLGRRVEQGGYEVSWVERTTFPGYERFHCKDPFGNRIEVMAQAR